MLTESVGQKFRGVVSRIALFSLTTSRASAWEVQMGGGDQGLWLESSGGFFTHMSGAPAGVPEGWAGLELELLTRSPTRDLPTQSGASQEGSSRKQIQETRVRAAPPFLSSAHDSHGVSPSTLCWLHVRRPRVKGAVSRSCCRRAWAVGTVAAVILEQHHQLQCDQSMVISPPGFPAPVPWTESVEKEIKVPRKEKSTNELLCVSWPLKFYVI